MHVHVYTVHVHVYEIFFFFLPVLYKHAALHTHTLQTGSDESS